MESIHDLVVDPGAPLKAIGKLNHDDYELITPMIDAAVEAPAQEILFDVLMAIIRLRAMQHKLEPVNLSGRKELEKIVRDPTADIALRHGWRAAVAGRDIEDFLAGRQQLVVREEQLVIDRTI